MAKQNDHPKKGTKSTPTDAPDKDQTRDLELEQEISERVRGGMLRKGLAGTMRQITSM
jgi:hypothetical protein